MKQKYRSNIKINYVFHFLNSFDLTSSIWVLYLVFKGLPLWQIGLLEGAFHIVSFLSEIPTGAAADLLGRKKVMLLSRICHAVSAIIILFASDFWHFAIGFVFSAWGYNLISGSEEALVYDTLKIMGKEDRYLMVSGRLEILFNIAQGIATFVGGVLVQKSFYYCYAVVVVICLVTLIPGFLLKEPELIKLKNKEKITFLKHFKNSFKIIKENPRVVKILISYSFIFTFYMIVYYYGQEYLSEIGLNKLQISIVMLISGIASCLGAIACKLAVNRFKKHTQLVAAILISLGILGLVVGRIEIAIACFGIMGFANTLLYPLQSDELNRLIPSDQRATILSVNSMCFSSFMLILFPIVGGIADLLGLKVAFLGLGVALMILSLGYFSINRFQKSFTI